MGFNTDNGPNACTDWSSADAIANKSNSASAWLSRWLSGCMLATLPGRHQGLQGLCERVRHSLWARDRDLDAKFFSKREFIHCSIRFGGVYSSSEPFLLEHCVSFYWTIQMAL